MQGLLLVVYVKHDNTPACMSIVHSLAHARLAPLVNNWDPRGCLLQGMNFVAGCLLLFMDEEDAPGNYALHQRAEGCFVHA
jgi:hypothetical protein